MENTKDGKFIVIYGVSNLGKKTQARLLTERLTESGFKVCHVKYPVYGLKPSGVILNNYLRGGNTYNLNGREAQTIYALNRYHFEPELKRLLSSGVNVIAEDYIGTGLAWGRAYGLDDDYLKHLNSRLRKEDLAFLFYGQPFLDKASAKHRHESDPALSHAAANAFERLSAEFSWIKVNANRPIREINQSLFDFCCRFIKNRQEPRFQPEFLSQLPSLYAQKNKTKRSSRRLKVRRLSPVAKMPRWNPEYFGFDLFSSDHVIVAPGRVASIDTGLKLLIPPDMHGFVWNIKNAKLTMSLSGRIESLRISHKNESSLAEHFMPGELIGRLHLHRTHYIDMEEKEI